MFLIENHDIATHKNKPAVDRCYMVLSCYITKYNYVNRKKIC